MGCGGSSSSAAGRLLPAHRRQWLHGYQEEGFAPAHNADSVFLAGELGLHASTIGRVLHRHRVPALAAIDAISREPVRPGTFRHSRRPLLLVIAMPRLAVEGPT
jgi:hypothetical protein